MKIKHTSTGFEIAVIGLAGKFPGSNSVTAFWENLLAGRDAISTFTDEELRAQGVHPDVLKHPGLVRAKGVFPELEFFDASFFDYTPRDAALLDPQVRALHECIYLALEDGGYGDPLGKRNIGLFAGASGNFTWELSTLLDAGQGSSNQFAAVQLNDKDFLATRIAYKLNLQGPCATVHTACSTSLYAVDLACRNLLTGACSMAIAAGAGLSLPQKNGYAFEEGMIKSADGACRPFSDDANGTVEGNGVGAVLLKPLEAARQDRDRIYAVIRGIAVNNDGSRKVGYSAPSVEGQAEVIRRALRMAEVPSESIRYVECHGTGTRLGDPVEIEGLRKAYRTTRQGFCGIGSLKSNIGHLDTAAGISALIKAVLVLQHQTIPPSLHFDQPNPDIDFAQSPFRVITTATPLERAPVESEAGDVVWPLRAGVSSFGIGGTNVHAILEEAPPPSPSGEGRRDKLLCLSGRDPRALDRQEEALLAYLESHPDLHAADLAYSYQEGRQAMPSRTVIPFRDIPQLIESLRRRNEADTPLVRIHQVPRQVRVAFLFPGQGTQYPGMAAALADAEPIFREELESCLQACERHGAGAVRPLLLAPDTTTADIYQTAFAQVALFVTEYALARLLMRWGVQPAALIGHSLGEYVAATVAGTIGLDEAIGLVILRGQLMQETAAGAMLAVMATEAELSALLPPALDLAAVNAPSQCVVSGPSDAIAAFAEALAERKIMAKPVRSSHAAHSALIEPMIEPFRAALQKVTFKPPAIPYVSNVSGKWITAEQACDPEYYLQHLRQPVRFAEGAATLLADEPFVCVEAGPGNVLGAFLKQNLTKSDGGQRDPATLPVVSLLRHARQNDDPVAFFTLGLGALWGHGVRLNWKDYYRRETRSRIAVPGYRFEPQRHSLGRGDIYTLLESLSITKPASATSAAMARAHEGIHAFGWEQVLLPPPGDSHAVHPCLAFFLGGPLAKVLPHLGGLRLTPVRPGKAFAAGREDGFLLNFERVSDFRRLFRQLGRQDGLPGLLLWTLPTLGRAGSPAEAPLFRQTELLASVASILKEECPAQRFRFLVLLPLRGTELAFETAFALHRLGLTLRATVPEFDLRFVGIQATATSEIALDQIGRELHDPSRQVHLVHYRQRQRFAFVARQTVALTDGYSPFAGRTLGLFGSAELPVVEIAAHLRALTGCAVTPLPGPDRANRLEHSTLRFDAAAQRDVLRSLQARYLRQFGLQDNRAHYQRMDELSTALVARVIDAALPLRAGTRFDRPALKAALRVTDRLEKYVDYFLHLLAADGLIQGREDGWEVIRGVDSLRAPQVIADELNRETPLFRGPIRMLEHCVQAFPKALPEQTAPIEVLYPQGRNQLLRETYENSIQDREDEYIRQLFENLIARIIPGTTRLRILEVGGGYGLVMRRIVPLLRGLPDVEYYFTDVGPSFLQDAETFALEQGYDFMTFGLFDITQDPVSQGLDADSFDLVLAFNVVHATRNLRVSLRHLHSLLKPAGLLCLLERTQIRRHVDLVWGLADGWWHFDREDGRQLSPLMELARWEKLARELAPASVLAFPEEAELREKLDVGLIVIEKAIPPMTPVAPAASPTAAAAHALDVLLLLDGPSSDRRAVFRSHRRHDRSEATRHRAWLESVEKALHRHQPQQTVLLSLGQPEAGPLHELDRQAAVQRALDLARALSDEVAQIYLPFADTIAPAASSQPLPSLPDLRLALLAAESGLSHVAVRLGAQPLFCPRQIQDEGPHDLANSPAAGPTTSTLASSENPVPFVPLLQSLWSNLFGIPVVRPNDDFFALGGDSLKAAQFTTELEKHGLKILPNEVFNFPRLQDLANYLQQHYGAHLTTIQSEAALLEHFRTQFGLSAHLEAYALSEGCWEKNQVYRVLYLPDAVCAQGQEVEQFLLALKLDVSLQPHYVLPESWRPLGDPPQDAASFARAFRRVGQERSAEIDEAIRRAKVRQTRFSLRIREGKVELSYPVSGFQKMYLRGTTRVSLYQVEFDELLDRNALNQAFTDIVRLQGLLRSSLDRSFRRLNWNQHVLPPELYLPEIDFSAYSDEAKPELMRRLMAQEYETDFDAENGVMYHVLLVRLDLRRHVLLFNLDHSIFDNMSGQVLRRQLINRYRARLAGNVAELKPVKPFSDYLRQLVRGPQGIRPAQLIELFDLEAYGRASRAVEKRIVAHKQKQVQTLRFEVDLAAHQLADDDEIAWEVCLLVLTHALARYFDQPDVPLKIIYQGRKYQDYSFFDTLGLFVDVVPLLVRVRPDQPETMIAEVKEKLSFINRYNVNFMNLVLNLGMMIRWQSVLGHISTQKLSRSDPMILLNYAGKAEKEYRKIIDFATSQMLNTKNRLSYASFYAIAAVTEGRIVFDIICDFEPKMDRLKAIFAEESARVLSRNAPPTTEAAATYPAARDAVPLLT